MNQKKKKNERKEKKEQLFSWISQQRKMKDFGTIKEEKKNLTKLCVCVCAPVAQKKKKKLEQSVFELGY